ncbi:hypothetical protein HDU88_008381 [Geranomyces variabilis]|nr:hypothetical protein HDU88_008381 [Geranomyces variabilis]
MNGSATILIVCMDPGKAKYNSLTSPFEIELVTICKAIHILAATIVAQLLTNTGGAPGQSTLEFLRDEALPNIRSALSTPGGLADARDKLCLSLNRVYSVGAGDPSFGQRSAALKATDGRRSMLAVGNPFSEERQQMLAGIMVIVNEHAALGATALLPDLLPCLSFGEIGDAAWQTFVLSSAGNKDLWEAAKSYGKHVTDGMSAAEKKAYAAKRFVRMPDAAATLAALRTHNDTCVRKIGAPGYTWLKANDRIYLYECDRCGEFFLANAKGPRPMAIAMAIAAAKLSPPNELTDVVQTHVPGAAAPVSLLLVKGSMLNNDELEFLSLLEFTRTTATGESAKRPSTKALNSKKPCDLENKKQQHKCAPGRPYMHPVAETPVILSFSQLPPGYQLALLAEAAVSDQSVACTLRAANLDWRTLRDRRVGSPSLTNLLPLPPSGHAMPLPPAKRARLNYSAHYTRLDELQALQDGPLSDKRIRQELLAMGLTPAQQKTASTGWKKRARKD